MLPQGTMGIVLPHREQHDVEDEVGAGADGGPAARDAGQASGESRLRQSQQPQLASELKTEVAHGQSIFRSGKAGSVLYRGEEGSRWPSVLSCLHRLCPSDTAGNKLVRGDLS